MENQGFFVPKRQIKKLAGREIEEGTAEYLRTPRHEDGLSCGLADSFESRRAQEPLREEDIKREVESFVNQNFEKFVSMLMEKEDIGKLVNEPGLTNEQIGLLNADYYIEKGKNGQTKVLLEDCEVYPNDISLSDFLKDY